MVKAFVHGKRKVTQESGEIRKIKGVILMMKESSDIYVKIIIGFLRTILYIHGLFEVRIKQHL